MTRPIQPPRLARRLLARALPDDAREHIEGDLLELYGERCARDGRARARRWYWREAGAFSARFLVERLRDRFHVRVVPSALDVRLAMRVLVKYPGLTVVGGLAIAVAIAVGAAFFEFGSNVFRPTIPLPEGDRIVGLRNWDAAASATDARSLHDFETWRTELRSVREVGAFTNARRNLIGDDGRAEPVEVAEISASAFRLVRVPPMLGRPLVAGDEAPDAPPVVVIGYDMWRTRFGGDPAAVGSTLRLGHERSTIVGVMPHGFAFPARHAVWTPLRARAIDYERRAGPALRVFGRLAPGVSIEQAQAELTALGTRTAAAHPQTHAQLRPRVVPYATLFFDVDLGWRLYLLRVLFAMVLVLACLNVATLVFARTAARENEIAVRSALGAGRARIVGQLFVEALVLAAAAAVAGLAAAQWGLRAVMDTVAAEDGGLPFWCDFDLSPATVLYAGGLTVLGAIVAGVVPALKVTQGGLQTRLRQAAAGGSGLRFGRLWTGIIVTQVAISVAVLPILVSEGWGALQAQSAGVGYAASEYLSATIAMDRVVAPGQPAGTAEARFAAAFADRRRELARRLAAEPGVTAVTFASTLPGMGHPTTRIAPDAATPDGSTEQAVSTAAVDLAFFDAFEAPVLAGRLFTAGDLEPGRDGVVVNQAFVREVFGGRDPIGRRVREVREGTPRRGAPPAPTYQIVGVVRDLGRLAESVDQRATMYRPAAPNADATTLVAIRVAGSAPSALVPRLRAIALAVDPTLSVDEVRPLDQVGLGERMGVRLLAAVMGLFAVVALLLSSAGIYAMMAFTVSQRTREIGIRAALGAHPGRIVSAIFARGLWQLAAGVVVGSAGAALLVAAGLGTQLEQDGPWLMLGVAAFVIAVGLAACAVPARRALRIQPTEALRQVS